METETFIKNDTQDEVDHNFHHWRRKKTDCKRTVRKDVGKWKLDSYSDINNVKVYVLYIEPLKEFGGQTEN